MPEVVIKKFYLQRDYAAGVYMYEAPSPPTLTWGGGGAGEPERRLEGQQFTWLGRKYQHY
jgi:hypothetical protein